MNDTTSSLGQNWCALLDRLAALTTSESEKSESRRLARLQTGFVVIGLIFGALFVVYYGLLGHWSGVGIIITCMVALAGGIGLLRAGRSTRAVGHWMSGILFLGFAGLTLVEGGIDGHATAWLAAVPLCSLMLIGSHGALFWLAWTLLALAAFFLAAMLGFAMPVAYDPRWHTLITGVGYLALAPFLLGIAITFEFTRRRAIEAREAAFAELAEAHARLTRLNEEKDQFLGMAAHDLRNPLGVIVGYTDLLRLTIPEEHHAYLQKIRESSQRMTSLLDDLLNLNAIEQGRFPVDLETRDLDTAVEEAVERARIRAEEKSMALEVETSGGNPGRIDDRALGQVLDNLISNAIKYSEPGTRIQIVSRSLPKSARVEVRDEGPGFSEEDRAKLYDRFAKLSARPTGGESSTGLGLSIVKRMTEAMEGRIECLPNEPRGTCFRLEFSAAIEPQQALETTPSSR